MKKIRLEVEISLVHIVVKFLSLFFKKPVKKFNRDAVKRILIVNTTAIGDTLMCTPAIKAIRKNFPEAFIADLVHVRRKEILEDNPRIDKLLLYKGKWRKLFSLVREIRSYNFDTVIILHANDPDIIPIMYFSGASWIVGWEESRFNYLLDASFPHEVPGDNFVERRMIFLEGLGLMKQKDYRKEIFLKDEHRAYAEKIITKNNTNNNSLTIALHAGASVAARRWSADNFVALGRKFEQVYGAQLVLIGGSETKEISSYIAERLINKPLDLTGKLGIKQSAAILQKTHVLVTADSGPAHLASAVREPMVVLFGPISKETAQPLYSKKKSRLIQKAIDCERPCRVKECLDKGHLCMNSITVDEVFEEVKSLVEFVYGKALLENNKK